MVRFDADKTKASDVVARLTKNSKYASSQIESLGAELDADYAKVSAHAEVKRKGGKGKVVVQIDPKAGRGVNGDKQPELEIEVKLPEGLSSKNPVLKDKKGVKGRPRELSIEIEVDPKAASGERAITVEVRMVVTDKDGKNPTHKVVQLPVPVVIP